MPAGRPTDYTQELADRICEELAQGKSLRTVCLGEDLPAMRTVFYWLRTHEEFLHQYTRAKAESADAMADEVLDIADNGRNDWHQTRFGKQTDREAIERSRLRVETRKWLMAKMKPKKYGDSVKLEGGATPIPLQILGGATKGIAEAKTDESN